MLAFVYLISLATPASQGRQEKQIGENHEHKLPNACPTKGDPIAVGNMTFLWHFVAAGCQPSGAK